MRRRNFLQAILGVSVTGSSPRNSIGLPESEKHFLLKMVRMFTEDMKQVCRDMSVKKKCPCSLEGLYASKEINSLIESCMGHIDQIDGIPLGIADFQKDSITAKIVWPTYREGVPGRGSHLIHRKLLNDATDFSHDMHIFTKIYLQELRFLKEHHYHEPHAIVIHRLGLSRCVKKKHIGYYLAKRLRTV